MPSVSSRSIRFHHEPWIDAIAAIVPSSRFLLISVHGLRFVSFRSLHSVLVGSSLSLSCLIAELIHLSSRLAIGLDMRISIDSSAAM